MKYLSVFFILLFLSACTSGEQTLLFECNEQNVGEACNKLGKKREGKEAVAFFRKGCELESTNSCVSLAEKIKEEDRPEALRVLAWSCDKGNTRACALFGELATTPAN